MNENNHETEKSDPDFCSLMHIIHVGLEQTFQMS